MLYAKWEQISQLAEKSEERLSRDDIKRASDNPEAGLLSTQIRIARDRATEAENPANSNLLFANRAHPLRSITPLAIKQGFIGDCVLEATLASMARSQPAWIERMIKSNADGTYTVTKTLSFG